MTWLAGLFALTAALYASVGFGGGSTYNALLVLADTDYRILPAIALICNIVVVTGGSVRYARAREVPWRALWPILIVSAPMAWLGGRLAIDRALFVLLLGSALLVAGLSMLAQRERTSDAPPRPVRPLTAPATGAGVGLLSGLVGIGGGIFLAPILHLLRWDTPRRIAATASVFILVNSIAGLTGQFAKLGGEGWRGIAEYWPLMLAVLVGGQVGSLFGAKILPQRLIRVATAILILYVAVRLLWQAITGSN